MSLIIQLPAGIERVLKGKAALQGLSLERYIAELLAKESLQKASQSLSEAELLELVQLQLGQAEIARYLELKAAFALGSLSEEEREELIQLNDFIEIAHAERMKYAAQLAKQRGQTLEELTNELGLNHISG